MVLSVQSTMVSIVIFDVFIVLTFSFESTSLEPTINNACEC
jgi:hypothetical protein